MPRCNRIGSVLVAGSVVGLVVVLAGTGCVHVPENVRAQFSPPGSGDRSNFRHGAHGKALPTEDPVVRAATASVKDADAGAASEEPASDAGVAPSSTDGGVDQGGTS